MTASVCTKTFARAHRLVPAVLAVALVGCQTVQPTETTGSLGVAAAPRAEGDWRRAAEAWGERYRAEPGNPDVGIYKQALEVLNRAHTPDQPDWRILSVQGAALDQMGRHEEAQRYYATALKIVPDEPSVLSNLGLSYALSKDLVRAESTLRRAATQSRDARVRQNLALVVGLQGRFSEAEGIARTDLPSDEAAANVAYLRRMLAQQNGWKEPDQPGKPSMKAQGS